MSVERVTPTTGNTLGDLGRNFLKNIVNSATYPGENILHNYRTFNYRVTLAVVSPQEFTSGSYKSTGFSNVIFSSYGKGTGSKIKSNSQTLNNVQNFINVLNQSQNANYDYYLQDLYIKNYVSAARDWTTEIKLKIVEPYSIDTFLNNIISALTVKGYKNFDKTNAFVLKIDFVGYHEDSEQPELIPYSTRYYPMIITNMEAQLSQEGTVWEIKGVPINQSGTYDDVNIIPQNLSISGNTVKDILKDLEVALEEIRVKAEKDTNIKRTKYKIVFLDEKGNVTEKSPFADAVMFDPVKDAGTREFRNKSLVTGTVQQGERPEDIKLALTVSGNEGLTRIIDSIIQDSHLVVEKIKNQFQGDIDSAGWIKWWRVVTKVDILEHDASINQNIRQVTFQIVPRKVHYTKLTSIFVPTYKPSAKDFESMTARRYQWQYTGSNKDILSFNLNFNQLWTRIITGNLGASTAAPGSEKTDKSGPVTGLKGTPGKSPTPADMVAQNTQPDYTAGRQDSAVKSSANTDPLFVIARDINRIINSPYENIELNMEILGDPMWLGTQFIENGSTIAPDAQLFTVDGGIALRSVDPMIRVVAYSPRDFNSQGFLTSGESNEDKALSKISAYYTVREVESSFSGGVFKQKLIGTRNISQDLAATEATGSAKDRFTLEQIDFSIRK